MYILVMAFLLFHNGHNSMSSIQVEYTSEQKCEYAKKINRENLQRASVILATCTKK